MERERGGGGGREKEEKRKGDNNLIFFACVFLSSRKTVLWCRFNIDFNADRITNIPQRRDDGSNRNY